MERKETSVQVAPLVETPVRTLSISLSDDGLIRECPCWLAFYRPSGTLHPGTVLKSANWRQIFDEIVQDGLHETDSLLLADTSPTRMLYAVPFTDELHDEKLRQAVEEICSWGRDRIGIHLSEELLGEKALNHFLLELIPRLFRRSLVSDIFIPVCRENFVPLLNLLVAVKHEIERTELNGRVFLFH